MPAFSKTHTTPGCCFVALWNNVEINVWLDRPNGVASKITVKLVEELRQTHDKLSVLHIMEDGAALPTLEGRDELMAGARNNATALACVGVLLPSKSVVANMLRAFVRGFRTLLPFDMTTVVEQDMDTFLRQVVDLHVRNSGVKITTSDLGAAIADARRLAAKAK